MTDLAAIYTREWYEHDFAGLREEFRTAALGLDRWARSHRFGCVGLDVGCGPGMLVAELRAEGWSAHGFDGSTHAMAYAQAHVPDVVPFIAQGDILEGPELFQSESGTWSTAAPVVICTEVAEHLEAHHAPALVRFLAKSAGQAIVFTAAPPGQGGHHHVNEQPPEYWLELFAERGWIQDREGTEELRRRWSKLARLSHMTRNVMVLR